MVGSCLVLVDRTTGSETKTQQQKSFLQSIHKRIVTVEEEELEQQQQPSLESKSEKGKA
jgi:hypothetical protein